MTPPSTPSFLGKWLDATRALSQRPFVRNALTLGSGTALGQVAVLAVTPLLTRIYGPETMAMLGMYLAFLAPASVALTLRYDLAIVLARNDSEAGLLLLISLGLVPVVSGLAGIVFGVFAHHDVIGFGLFPGWAAPMMTAVLVLTGAFTSLRFWCVRAGAFRDISRGLVQQGIARAIVPLAVALVTRTWIGLLAGEVAGRIFGIRRLLQRAAGTLRATAGAVRKDSVVQCLRHYWQFPALHLPSSVIDAVGGTISTPLFASAFGASDGGQFFLAHRLVLAPAALLSAAVADVYHHRVVEAARAERSGGRRAVLQAARYLLIVGAAIYVPVAVVASVAAPWLFGPAWTQIGVAIALLVPVAISATVTSPLSRSISLSLVPQAKWVADVVRFSLPVGTILLCAQWGATFRLAVAAFSAATVVGDVVYFSVILYTIAPHRLRDM